MKGKILSPKRRFNSTSAALAILFVALLNGEALAITYTTFDHPLAVGANGTRISGADGTNLVGSYSNISQHGFIYDGFSFRTIDNPSGDVGHIGYGTLLKGISGNFIVGIWTAFDGHSAGFLYDGSSFVDIIDPLGGQTGVQGISGNTIVGNWQYNGSGSFLYDIPTSTFTELPRPLGATGMIVRGISGNNIVGYYGTAAGVTHGFLYNGSSFTTLDHPSAGSWTEALAISGSNNIVGRFIDSAGVPHGFLDNGSSWTTLDFPGGQDTRPWGIFGNTVVGAYLDSSLVQHGFIATIPEPSSLVLLVIGGLGLTVLARVRRRRKPDACAAR